MSEKMRKALYKNKLNKKEYIEDNYEGYSNYNNSKRDVEEHKKSNKQKKLAKKLEYIFNKVRETGKYEYKKQELPESLKYHTDSDSSYVSKEPNFSRNKNLDVPFSKNLTEIKKINTNLTEGKFIYKDEKLIINKENEKTNQKKIKLKKNNVREIIEKLKILKAEKEDLIRQEKEAEEASLMDGKIRNNNINEEIKEEINDSEKEKDEEKINKKENKNEKKTFTKKQRIKKEDEIGKNKKIEKNFKKIDTTKINNMISTPIKRIYTNELNKKMIYMRNQKKKASVFNLIGSKNLTLQAYKKPIASQNKSLKSRFIFHKAPINSVISRNKRLSDHNIFKKNKLNETNPEDKNTISFTESKKLRAYCNLYKSTNLTFLKNDSINKLKNYMNLNKSLRSCIQNKQKTKDINIVNSSNTKELYSSFDSHLPNYNKNVILYRNNLFNDENKKLKYNNSSNNSCLLTNSSNNFGNINNFYNIGRASFFSGENKNNNNDNSFIDKVQTSINSINLNSSYNLEPNNSFINNFFYYNNQANPNLLHVFNKSLNIKTTSIKIEELLILEEKFLYIILSLNNKKPMYNECSDFLNYYFNSSLCGSIEKIFISLLDINDIKTSIKYILMSIIICYDCSFDIEILNSTSSILKLVLNLIHKNLIFIYEHILGNIGIENRDNRWVKKLVNVINSDKNSEINNKFNKDEDSSYGSNKYSMNLIEKINFNNGVIVQNIRGLLKNYKFPQVEKLTSLFIKLNEKSYYEIDIFYKQNILNVENPNGSIYAPTFLKQNLSTNFIPVPYPYIYTSNPRQFSLVLDLNETLVHLQIREEQAIEYVLKIRPGLSEFLEELSQYYELIAFTGSTQENANIIIDAIEEGKIFFDQRLYRNHMIIIDNDFVKDLSRIGRPLDKIIIVDNRPQNFRLQKENGICIKSFFGEDKYDMNLINLKNILINIAQEGGDLRIGIQKYKNNILEKVESNLYKNSI